jgi:hypothetical protein
MLSQTVQHPVIMHIAAAILISKTFSIYKIDGFEIIIIIIITQNKNKKLDNKREKC